MKTTELLRAVGLVFTSVYLKMLTVLKKLLWRSKKCENDLHILLPLVVMVRLLSHLSYSSRKGNDIR